MVCSKCITKILDDCDFRSDPILVILTRQYLSSRPPKTFGFHQQKISAVNLGEVYELQATNIRIAEPSKVKGNHNIPSTVQDLDRCTVGRHIQIGK